MKLFFSGKYIEIISKWEKLVRSELTSESIFEWFNKETPISLKSLKFCFYLKTVRQQIYIEIS